MRSDGLFHGGSGSQCWHSTPKPNPTRLMADTILTYCLFLRAVIKGKDGREWLRWINLWGVTTLHVRLRVAEAISKGGSSIWEEEWGDSNPCRKLYRSLWSWRLSFLMDIPSNNSWAVSFSRRCRPKLGFTHVHVTSIFILHRRGKEADCHGDKSANESGVIAVWVLWHRVALVRSEGTSVPVFFGRSRNI